MTNNSKRAHLLQRGAVFCSFVPTAFGWVMASVTVAYFYRSTQQAGKGDGNGQGLELRAKAVKPYASPPLVVNADSR